ncbi:transposon Ty3-I Gag-Pol polyprotein [Trichonephila clavipes]|nr:transposon Ty3-I Gag-Pol polyprotein [Trichonephila clavipes]
MRIIVKDEEPVCQHPCRLAFTERQEVNKQIEEWLNEGIIRPSSSEYASPIVMVKKKDGSSRMCIDYRKLNHKQS